RIRLRDDDDQGGRGRASRAMPAEHRRRALRGRRDSCRRGARALHPARRSRLSRVLAGAAQVLRSVATGCHDDRRGTLRPAHAHRDRGHGAAADRGARRGERRLMPVRIVRLGTPRAKGEEPRLGTVRRPPRGVPKSEFARRDFYDAWFPTLAPSVETMKLGLAAATGAQWARFAKKYRGEMARPDARHAIELLALLSRHADFSVGCYCEDESRCHRSLLRELLASQGAEVA